MPNYNKSISATSVRIGEVRFSYAYLFAPRANDDGTEKYSVQLLIPKSDTTAKKILDAAIEAADIVLMDDSPSKIARAVELSRMTMRIVHENIFFSLAVKAIVLILTAIGLTGMWLAVFADVGVMVIAILNSMRTLAYKNTKA